MVEIRHFKGYRPVWEKVSFVSSPPYDVLSSEEARELAKENPISFLHVIKPEIDFNKDTILTGDKIYRKGAENLKKLIDNKILIQEKQESYYIYSQKIGNCFQTGIVVLASTEDYINDKIKKHEHTNPDKVKIRLKHIEFQNAHSGPVFLMYKNEGKSNLNNIIQKIQKRKPDTDINASDSVRHILWVVDDENDIKSITEFFKSLDRLYIADGHHRSEAAVENFLRNRAECPSANIKKTEATKFFLAVLFEESQLNIMGYNRVITDIKGMSVEEFLNSISDNFKVGETDNPIPDKRHKIGMYINRKWYCLEIKSKLIDENDPVKRLDVEILQKNLLDSILGIKDPRSDKRIDFIGGIRGEKELEKLVDNNQFKVAFVMYPVITSDIISVANEGEVMPLKSTWFEPKLQSGLVVNIFREF